MAEENELENPVVDVEKRASRVRSELRPQSSALLHRCVWEQKLDRKFKPLREGYRGRKAEQEIVVLTRIRADLFKAIVLNPTHARVRVAYGDGPNTVIAGFLDSGYILSNMRSVGTLLWVLARIPKKESVIGYYSILSTPM